MTRYATYAKSAARVGKKPADVACWHCGRPLADCTVGGLHGRIRDAAAANAKAMLR